MTTVRVAILVALTSLALAANGWAKQIVILSTATDSPGGGDASLITALRDAGYVVDTSLMGQPFRLPQFDKAMLDAFDAADAIVYSANMPTVDTNDFAVACDFNSTRGVPLPIAHRLLNVQRPQQYQMPDGSPIDLTALAQQIAGSEHPPQALPHPDLGDFNNNGIYDVGDIDRMVDVLHDAPISLQFDVTRDGSVDRGDYDFLITNAMATWFGDANFDGSVGSADFVQVFQAGTYERAVDAHWAEGDWNGDRRFDSSDFVAVFQPYGYCPGPRTAVAAVPEPSVTWLLFSGVCSLLVGRRRASSR